MHRITWQKWVARSNINAVFMPPPEGRGNKHCFCLSIRLSVAYIANNLRTQRPSVPKFERRVPHFWCDSHASFKVKKSKVEVTRPINGHTHRVPTTVFQMARPTNFKRGMRMEDDDPHQPQAPWPQRSRSQGHVISLSRLAPMLYLCH